MLKLPPRFKIYYNESEDHYFIKERFLLFFFRSMVKEVGYQYYGLIAFSTLEEAEEEIEYILESEKLSRIPDKIKKVKEYD